MVEWQRVALALTIVGMICPELAAAKSRRSTSRDGTPARVLKRLKVIRAGFKPAWHDEFDGTALDEKKWEYRYVDRPRGPATMVRDSVKLDGKGFLHITTFKKDGKYFTGMLGTQPTFTQKYGYFEARIKFQSLQGHHGAFWLQSPTYDKHENDPAKAGAEVDIIEFFGSGRSDRGAQTNVYCHPHKEKKNQIKAEPDLSKILRNKEELCDRFHVFSLKWTEEGYVFYIDGVETFRTSKAVSHVEQYIVLSLIISDWESKRLKDEKLPDSMVVDYVRVYEAK